MARDHAPERVLVVAALAGGLAASWPVRDGLGRLEWRWIVPRARRLGVAARLWAELASAGLDRDVPEAARASLQAAAHDAAADAALRSAAARQVGSLLDSAGVPWMPMKGAAVAIVAPEYGAVRPAVDVDLVVHPDELERAVHVLGAELRLAGERRDYDGAERDADSAMRDGVQHLYAFEALGGIPVELHHAFPGLTRREITDGIFSRASAVQVRGAPVRVPALDDLLGTACVHAVVVHGDERRFALRHLADVSELLALGASPDVARTRYDVEGRRAVASSLDAVARARTEGRTRGAPPSVASAAVEPGIAGHLRARVGRFRWRAGDALEGLRRRGLDAVVPPRRFMVTMYGPPAAGLRLPLLHLHRWGAILLRLLRGR